MSAQRKLTDQQAQEIRDNPLPPLPLAKFYGVAPKTIRQIRTGEIYKTPAKTPVK